jgi:hypothetical protein
MKLIKVGMVLMCTTFFALSALATATTVTDPTGDVWHWSETGGLWGWSGNVVSKPNIDITQMTADVSGGQLILTMTVSGVIENTDKTVYWMYYNTTDTSYWAYWSNGAGYGYGFHPNQTMPILAASVTISGNTATAKFNVTSAETAQKFWGWAAQYTVLESTNGTNEWWGDWAPNSELPFTPPGTTGGNTNTGNNTGGNTNTGNNSGSSSGSKTPGFELVPVVAAVAIAAILLRRRR